MSCQDDDNATETTPTTSLILAMLSPDIENMILSFVPPYFCCQGVRQRKIRDNWFPVDGRPLQVNVTCDGNYITNYYYQNHQQYLMNNGVRLEVTLDYPYGVSPNAAEFFIFHNVESNVLIYSLTDGRFLRIVRLLTPPGFSRGGVQRCLVNNRGQFVTFAQDNLMFCIFESDGRLSSSVTLVNLSSSFNYYNLDLITPEIIHGDIYLRNNAQHSIHVYDSFTGKLKRRMFGDNIAVRDTSSSEYKNGKFGDIENQDFKTINDGIIIDYCGNVVFEFGSNAFCLKMPPKISPIGEIIVYKKKHFLIYNLEGKFLRKFQLDFSIAYVSAFTLDNLGRIVLYCWDGSIWVIE